MELYTAVNGMLAKYLSLMWRARRGGLSAELAPQAVMVITKERHSGSGSA